MLEHPARRFNTMDLLFTAYQKKVSSLNLHLDKITADCDIELLHHLRVEIKKIRVIFHLLEILEPEKFDEKYWYADYRKIFKYAGLVRELQLSIKALEKYHVSQRRILPFKKFLLREEKTTHRKLFSFVEKKKIKLLQKPERKIRKICSNIKTRDFILKTFAYILSETDKISNLINSSAGLENVHKIRQNLKSVVAVIGMIQPIIPSDELASASRKIKVIDNLIGSYRDHCVLVNDLARFIKIREEKNPGHISSLESFSVSIKHENDFLLKRLEPKIKTNLKIILQNLTRFITLQLNEDSFQKNCTG